MCVCVVCLPVIISAVDLYNEYYYFSAGNWAGDRSSLGWLQQISCKGTEGRRLPVASSNQTWGGGPPYIPLDTNFPPAHSDSCRLEIWISIRGSVGKNVIVSEPGSVLFFAGGEQWFGKDEQYGTRSSAIFLRR